jgi:hypothetical protein
MSMAAILSLVLAFSTLDDAKRSAFFVWFHLEQTTSAGSVLTFQPVAPRLRDNVKVTVNADESGVIESTKLEMKSSFVAGRQVESARNLAKSFLLQAFAAEDNVQRDKVIQTITRFKSGHFESHFPSGALVSVDEDEGWLVIYAGRTQGPKLGVSFTSYKIKTD